ncbi:unnamed protein product [Brassica rapa subsp. trilocularis]
MYLERLTQRIKRLKATDSKALDAIPAVERNRRSISKQCYLFW